MLQRIALVVAVLYVVWRLLSAHGRRLGRTSPGADRFSRFSRNPRERWSRSDPDETDPREELVACASCGTLVPASRSRRASDGRPVCSEACRKALREGRTDA